MHQFVQAKCSQSTKCQQTVYDNVVHSCISTQAKSNLIFNQSLYAHKSYNYIVICLGPWFEKKKKKRVMIISTPKLFYFTSNKLLQTICKQTGDEMCNCLISILEHRQSARSVHTILAIPCCVPTHLQCCIALNTSKTKKFMIHSTDLTHKIFLHKLVKSNI